MESSRSTSSTLETNISKIKLDDMKFIFYWNSAESPSDENSEKKWTPYTKIEQTILNKNYEIFIKDNSQRKILLDSGYLVDFEKLIQIKEKSGSKIDESKIRHIRILDTDFNIFKEKFTDDYNKYLKENYHKFSQIFNNKINSHNEMKGSYRSNISNFKGEEKILLNVAYDYFSDPLRRESYNSKDNSKLKKINFDLNLLILKHDIESIKFILDNKSKNRFDVDTKGINDMSLLYMASRSGYTDIVKYLLQNGCNPSVIQGNKSSALHAASFYGNIEIVKLLLQIGVDANLKNEFNSLAEDEAKSDDIKNLIKKFKAEDLGYKFYEVHKNHFKTINFLFYNGEYIGKRAKLKNTNTRRNYGWDIAWHGTKLEFIPSIIKNGLKASGEMVDGKILDIRRDYQHIERGKKVRNISDWASAVFTSQSIFYSSNKIYSEHFKDSDGEEWILILECRIEKDSYHQYEHTFKKYELKLNENKLVENRSPYSEKVDVFAIWHFKKDFIDKQVDLEVLMDLLKNYIYEE